MDTASSSWGFLGNEEGPGARTRGLTQLGASDGEAWGLVTSPLCVSESERREEEAMGHSGWCEGGVSPGGSSRGVMAVT